MRGNLNRREHCRRVAPQNKSVCTAPDWIAAAKSLMEAAGFFVTPGSKNGRAVVAERLIDAEGKSLHPGGLLFTHRYQAAPG